MEKIYKHSQNLIAKLVLCLSFVFAYANMNAQCGFTFNVSTSYATCETSADGTANIKTFGGTPPMTIQWEDGQTNFFATGLVAVSYTHLTLPTICSV